MKILRTALCLSALLSANGLHPGASMAEGPLAGTFMYIGTSVLDEGVTYAQIGPYLDELKNDLQMNTVVLVFSKINLGTCTSPNFQWALGMDPNELDGSSKLLALAQGALARQMDLYIGLVNAGNCPPGSWTTPPNPANINAQTGASVLAIKNKLNRPLMGASNPYLAVKGWYIPDEPGDCPSFFWGYYPPIVQAIRSHSPASEGRKILLSPYLLANPGNLTPLTFAAQCRDLRNQAGIDILALQDSAGAGAIDPGHYGQPYNIEAWFSPLRDQIGISNLWADNELYTYANPLFPNPACPATLAYRATSFARLNAQLWQTRTVPAPSPVTSKRIAWLQQKHMGTTAENWSESRRLKAQYRAVYLGQGFLHAIQSYTVTPTPSPSYPDTNGTEMSNGITGDPSRPWHTGWTGVVGPVTIAANLGSPKTVDWVAVQLLQYPDWGIHFPGSLTLWCAPDDLSAWAQMGPVHNLDVPPPGCPSNREYIFSNETKLQHTCKWVRVELGNTGSWTFLGEIEISQEF
jgi:hypothetical protein